MGNLDHCYLKTTFCWSKILKVFASNQWEAAMGAQSVLVTHDSFQPWSFKNGLALLG